MVAKATKEVGGVIENYNMGMLTNKERYNQVIDIWSATNNDLTELSMKRLREDQQGFNSVYMMLDSGARGSKEQIRQLTGMRGLMAKPKKSSEGGEIIENPIISNFKEGLSILEYFISAHGARKGLADTALKTADAGYLTRRLVDVAHDVIINEEDCGTLRGLKVAALKKNEEILEVLCERIIGRFSLNDVYHPATKALLLESNELITPKKAAQVESAGIESLEVRSPLTCETTKGICKYCYGQNLATNKISQIGDAVGIIAAQSVGEPGTQLTLRTFHVGGVAGNVSEENKLVATADGILQIDDIRTIASKDSETQKDFGIVISRTSEAKILDKETRVVLSTNNIPYGSHLFLKDKTMVSKGDVICQWDPFNGVIVSEFSGKVVFENLKQGENYTVEIDEQTGFQEKVIIESKNKKEIPALLIQNKKGDTLRSYNLPLGGHLIVDDGKEIAPGQILVKVPRKFSSTSDITGGLPRVTELFEARNTSNPAVVSEIDGVVSFGKVKRMKREIVVESKTGEVKKYLIRLSDQILVQENDFVKAGMPLSEGSITPKDILRILGASKVQEYLVNEIQDVYRLQGVKINDKHFEVLVRQMMRKVQIIDSGDTLFLEDRLVDKTQFIKENDAIFEMKIVESSGDSQNLRPGQMVSTHKLRNENSLLRRQDKQLVVARNARPATACQVLQGITRAALQTDSFISAASFQETTRILNEAAIAGKVDMLQGLKENVIVGKPVPAGTGISKYANYMVGNKKETQSYESAKA